ncbi:MAG: glycosyltransferase family 39 protein [Candidatus Omnitrophica bacterium]|nr:glycosyltransferase family 39 protein [Candidatus Omnitrophota bacterium]
MDITNNRTPLQNFTFKLEYLPLARAFLASFNRFVHDTFYIYPPLVPVSYAFFYLLFGPHSGLETMVNMLYLAIALASIYGIGKKMLNEKAGLLAAFIFSSFPGVISLSREVYSEFNLMCIIAASFYFLLNTDFFRSIKYSVLFGIFLGLAALTKWEFPVTMAGPFFLYLSGTRLFVIGTKKMSINKRIFANLVIAISLGILISFFWYSVSWQDIIGRLFTIRGEIASGQSSALLLRAPLLQRFSYPLLVIINAFISLFYSLLFIISGAILTYRIIKSIRRSSGIRERAFYALFLLLWISIPCLVLMATPSSPSHIMPVLPAIAIVIGLGVLTCENRIARYIFVSSIILYGLGCHLHSFVDFGKLDVLYKLKLYLSPGSKFSLTLNTDNIPRDEWERKFFYAPDAEDWKIKKTLFLIKEDSRIIKPTILILGTQQEFSCFSFQYYNLLMDYKFFIEPRGNDRSPPSPRPLKFDYVIINTPINEASAEQSLSQAVKLNMNILKEMNETDGFKRTLFDKYELIKEYPLPDDTKAMIYKERGS